MQTKVPLFTMKSARFYYRCRAQSQQKEPVFGIKPNRLFGIVFDLRYICLLLFLQKIR